VLGAEIFPLRLRAKAASLGVAVERGMSGVVSMAFLSISKAMTVRRMFYLLLAVSPLCLIFLYFCVPVSFRVKPQEYLDKMATDPSELEPGNRRGIPVKAETEGVLTGGAVTVIGGAVNVTGGAVNVTVVAVNATGGTVTGGAVNVTAGAVTVTAGAVNATGGAVTRWLVTGGILTGGAVTGGAGGAGEAVTGREVRGTVVIGGVLTGGAVTGGAVTGGAVNVTGGAQEGQ